MGGHVRVGFEDNIYLSRGVRAKSNAELVEKIVRLAKELDWGDCNTRRSQKHLHLPQKPGEVNIDATSTDY